MLERVQPLTPSRWRSRTRPAACSPSDALAAVDLPPFPASAMDGFALRAADAAGRRCRSSRASRPAARRRVRSRPARRWRSRRAAVVPDGADTVVPIEDVEERDDYGHVPARGRRGDNVRDRGGDLRAGDTVVVAGTRLGPAHVGALAAAGVSELALPPRARASSSSSPARSSPRRERRSARARSTTRTASSCATQVRSAGAEVERLPPVKDDADATRAAIERGLAADVLVTTGGVSVGVYDLVRAAEAELGVEEVFWRVAVRPGKPIVVRRPRAHARLRAARQPRLLAGRLRAVRAPGAARAAGRCRRRRPRSGRGGSAAAGEERGARRARCCALARGSRTARSCSTR